MLPLHTARLTVRMMRAEHVATYHAYRNDPENARFQLWEMPFPMERAIEHAACQVDHDQVIVGEWSTLAIELDGQHIGDVVVNLDPTAKVAEIGFTLDRRFHGNGYASEAAAAVAEALFSELGLIRLYGELDPDNVASQRVLEAIGLRFEAITKRSFLWRGEWSDNMSYAATAAEHQAWRDRPRHQPERVELVLITPDDAGQWMRLETHYSQRRFVAPMPNSYCDALFPEVIDGAAVVPWMRGVLADGERAGFVMLADVTEHHPEPYLWRLLIDRLHQRRGIGRRVLDLICDEVQRRGSRSLLTSWEPGAGTPQPFYETYGFVATGQIVDGETEARLTLPR